MRDYDTDYRYADAVNRRARWGVVLLVAIVVGVGWAGNALDGDEAPSTPTVLAAQLGGATAASDVTAAGTSSTTSTRPAIVPGTTTSITATATTTTTAQSGTTTTLRSTTTRAPATTTTTTTLPPTTTTTVPPSTTTTVPPTTTTTTTTTVPVGTVHIHSLKGDARASDDGSYALIEVRIKDANEKDARGVVVTGQFSGDTEPVSGITRNRGSVVFESGVVEGHSVTFTVISVAHPVLLYAPEDNRTEPSITVQFE